MNAGGRNCCKTRTASGLFQVLRPRLWSYTLAVIASVSVGVVAPQTLHAASSSIASDAVNACNSAKSNTSSPIEQLQAQGWQEVRAFAPDARKALIDGAIAVLSDDESKKIDWQATQSQITDLVGKFEKSSKNGKAHRLFQYQHGSTAALFVANIKSENAVGVRCIYGGPSDPSLEKLVQSLSSMDSKVGRKQSNLGVDIHFLNATEDQTSISTKIAHYTKTLIPTLNRTPNAKVGISIIKLSQK